MNRLQKNGPTLQLLQNASTSSRKRILYKASPELIRCLCDCAHNILQGNVTLSRHYKQKLRQHKTKLRKLANHKVALKTNKQLILLLLLLLSAFPVSQGWPQRIIILHIFLSSMSISFAPTSFISSFTTSKNLLFGLPLFLFPGNFISIIFLPTCSWSLLMTYPYHLSLLSLSSFLTVLP